MSDDKDIYPCPICAGSGKIEVTRTGKRVGDMTCPNCHGTGHVDTLEQCPDCYGARVIRKNVQGFVDPYPCPTCNPQDKQDVSDESPEIEFPRTVEKIYADINDYFNIIGNRAFTFSVFRHHAEDIDRAEKAASIILDTADKILVSIQELKTWQGPQQIPYESGETLEIVDIPGDPLNETKLTPNGRKIHNKEETRNMSMPYPSDDEPSQHPE